MHFIVATVEDYIAPAIVYLTDFLKLSESLAGVTLIAFANGAGDVLTAIVAGDSAEGISYNVGALYGAGLFVITLVVGLTITNSTTAIQVSKNLIFRDVAFYIMATLFTLWMAYTEKITFARSLSLLGLYLSLVLMVVFQDLYQQKKAGGDLQKSLEANPQENSSQHDLEVQKGDDYIDGVHKYDLKLDPKKL